MQAQVECYAGVEYPTEPRALYWDGQRLEISAVLARWREPEQLGFRVQTRELQVFDLIYHLQGDSWEAQPIG